MKHKITFVAIRHIVIGIFSSDWLVCVSHRVTVRSMNCSL